MEALGNVGKAALVRETEDEWELLIQNPNGCAFVRWLPGVRRALCVLWSRVLQA